MAQLLELIQKKTFAFTFAGIAILYLFLFVTLLPHDSIWISDEGNRIAAVRAYAETSQKYLPDPFIGLEQVPGQGLRAYPKPYFVQEKDGQWRSAYSAFFPWTCSFLYKAAGRPGLVLLPVIAGVLSILFAGLIAKTLGLNDRKASLVMLLCAFGTPFLFYSGVFLETTTAAFFATAGIWTVLKAMDSPAEPVPLFCGGLLIGVSSLFREEGFILAFGIFLGIAVTRFSWKRLIVFSAGAWAVILPLMIFNWQDSGSVFGMHSVVYSAIGAVRSNPFFTAKLRDYLMYLTLLCMPVPILNSVPAILLAAGGIFCSWRKTASCAEAISYPLIAGLCLFSSFHNLFGDTRGVFIFQSLLDHLPVIAACIFSIPFLFRNNDRKVRFLAWVAAAGVLIPPAMLNEELIGMFWGGRHFMNIIPVVCVLTVALLSSDRLTRIAKYGICALIFASVVANAIGYGVLSYKKNFSQELFDALDRQEIKTIVTDVFWLPEELAWLPRDTRIIFMTDADSLERVAALCNANGIMDFHAVLGQYSRVLSNESIARVFQTCRGTPGKLFRKERLKFFTVQIFHIVLPPRDKPPKKD